MQRITISVDDDLAAAFEALVERRGYLNRSEAFRDLVRKELDAAELNATDAGAKAGAKYRQARPKHCVATVSYIYNHHERQLANRLTGMQHEHHDVAVAATHVHLDHDNCLETLILRGGFDEVRQCADAIVSQTGVRHGNVHMVPVDLKDARHHHGHTHAHPHR